MSHTCELNGASTDDFGNSFLKNEGLESKVHQKTSMKSVFVSSTVYDLLDIRAELEVELRDLGFNPVLSDRPSSDFTTSGTKDSIKTCLVNVEKSDIFLMLLSQRYGAMLGQAGFENLAATHLEYKEASKLGKPTFVYVRDRLAADFDTWRQQPKEKRNAIRLPWVKDKKDYGLFTLLEEHRLLKKDSGRSNWI